MPSAGPLGSSTAPAEPSRASGSGPGVYPAAGSRIVWVDLDRHTEFTYHGDPSVKIYTFGFSVWVVGIGSLTGRSDRSDWVIYIPWPCRVKNYVFSNSGIKTAGSVGRPSGWGWFGFFWVRGFLDFSARWFVPPVRGCGSQVSFRSLVWPASHRVN